MFENMLQMWHVEQHLVPRKVCQKDQHDEEAAVTCCCAQPQRMATRAGPGVRETQHPTQPPSSLRHATPSGELSLPLPLHQRPTPQAFALVHQCPVPSPPCALLVACAGATVTHRGHCYPPQCARHAPLVDPRVRGVRVLTPMFLRSNWACSVTFSGKKRRHGGKAYRRPTTSMNQPAHLRSEPTDAFEYARAYYSKFGLAIFTGTNNGMEALFDSGTKSKLVPPQPWRSWRFMTNYGRFWAQYSSGSALQCVYF